MRQIYVICVFICLSSWLATSLRVFSSHSLPDTYSVIVRNEAACIFTSSTLRTHFYYCIFFRILLFMFLLFCAIAISTFHGAKSFLCKTCTLGDNARLFETLCCDVSQLLQSRLALISHQRLLYRKKQEWSAFSVHSFSLPEPDDVCGSFVYTLICFNHERSHVVQCLDTWRCHLTTHSMYMYCVGG